MKRFPFLFLIFILLAGCSKEEASELERTNARFLDSLGGNVSTQQWWRTAVTVRVNVTTNGLTKLWLLSSMTGYSLIYDYKEISSSQSVMMTAPQGQGNTLKLYCMYDGKLTSQDITLTGNTVEVVSLNLTSASTRNSATRRAGSPPASLCGNSIRNNAAYYQFTDEQMSDFYKMMDLSVNNADAKKDLKLNTNYELESHGKFWITWVNGYEGAQTSRILGYYYHSPTTYDDIVYVDLSETHKWDYIDGLAKVQYQLSITDEIDGHTFLPNTWYDANFDLSDKYGATSCYNMDRVGDNAYNSQEIYTRYKGYVSAMRGISFEINVPENTRIGFYLRSDEEQSYPEQWGILQSYGIKPYTSNPNNFKGTCFCAELMNIEGNGRGTHRSFIKDYEEVIWMGMEDLVEGGDHDCNDVIFGVVSDLKIHMPEIVDPTLDIINNKEEPDPEPEPEPEPEPQPDPEPSLDVTIPFPWTIAFEDVGRDPDFDFNDAVIKLVPDFENKEVCVWVMAAGSDTRMYLHYDGPDGDQNLGEIHSLLGNNNPSTYINTTGLIANTPFVQVDCVPWPDGYTMANDAKRFYIEIQRGTCSDCTDVITLPSSPGEMPEALLIAGEWQWPVEGTSIYSSYSNFDNWARDATRTRYWDWYKTPKTNSFISY